MFNCKELDEETGLSYYGARYYDPRVSNWLSVDPIALYDPSKEFEHYIDGDHNGGYFNPRNTSVYGYCYQNPVKFVDPNGKQNVPPSIGAVGEQIKRAFVSLFWDDNSSTTTTSIDLQPKVGMQIYGKSRSGDVISGNGAKKSDGSIDSSNMVTPSGIKGRNIILKWFRTTIKKLQNMVKLDTQVKNNRENSTGTVDDYQIGNNMIVGKVATDDTKLNVSKGNNGHTVYGLDQNSKKDTLIESTSENRSKLRAIHWEILERKMDSARAK